MRSHVALLFMLASSCHDDGVPVPLVSSTDMLRFAGGHESRDWYCSGESGNGELRDVYEPFWIDRRTVSCRDYQACVSAKACQARMCGDDDVLRAPFDDALAYCHWRGATLPSYGQWVRAVRGLEHRELPAFSEARSCWIRTSKSSHHPRCAHITPEGVIYAMRGGGEWTLSSACNGRVMVNVYDTLSTVDIDYYASTLDRGGAREFRCVTEQPPTSPATTAP